MSDYNLMRKSIVEVKYEERVRMGVVLLMLRPNVEKCFSALCARDVDVQDELVG